MSTGLLQFHNGDAGLPFPVSAQPEGLHLPVLPQGLLYRRVDETEIFFYGEYEANYGDYKFPIKFTCKYNESFHT